jgi:hypothetical protein
MAGRREWKVHPPVNPCTPGPSPAPGPPAERRLQGDEELRLSGRLARRTKCLAGTFRSLASETDMRRGELRGL